MGMYTDDDLEELLKRNLKLTEENNRLLRKMRRAQMWGAIFKFVSIAVMVGVPLFFYFYFVQPYIEELQRSYAEIQENVEDIRNFPSKFPELPELPGWMQGFFGGDSEPESISTTTVAEE